MGVGSGATPSDFFPPHTGTAPSQQHLARCHYPVFITQLRATVPKCAHRPSRTANRGVYARVADHRRRRPLCTYCFIFDPSHSVRSHRWYSLGAQLPHRPAVSVARREPSGAATRFFHAAHTPTDRHVMAMMASRGVVGEAISPRGMAVHRTPPTLPDRATQQRPPPRTPVQSTVHSPPAGVYS